jgi:hypothetical protein
MKGEPGWLLHRKVAGLGSLVQRLIDVVSTGAFRSEKDKQRLRKLVTDCAATNPDPNQVTSGHDLCAALGIMLRDRIGSRVVSVSLASEVEMHLRLAFATEDFRRTGTFSAIRTWEEENRPFLVLRSDL